MKLQAGALNKEQREASVNLKELISDLNAVDQKVEALPPQVRGEGAPWPACLLLLPPPPLI